MQRYDRAVKDWNATKYIISDSLALRPRPQTPKKSAVKKEFATSSSKVSCQRSAVCGVLVRGGMVCQVNDDTPFDVDAESPNADEVHVSISKFASPNPVLTLIARCTDSQVDEINDNIDMAVAVTDADEVKKCHVTIGKLPQ